jgi:hypothetical protein
MPKRAENGAKRNDLSHGIKILDQKRRVCGLGSTRALACRGRRPRRPHPCIFSVSYWRGDTVGGGADCHTRGRVCSPELETRRPWRSPWGARSSRPPCLASRRTHPFLRCFGTRVQRAIRTRINKKQSARERGARRTTRRPSPPSLGFGAAIRLRSAST